jgi:dihydrofolate reductase
MEKSIAKQSNSPKGVETTPLSRPKVSIYIASSIDGYIARADGNLDWLHYGHTGEEDYGFKKFTSSIDAVVMGRNTYEVVAGFDEWPYKDKRVIVLSNTLTEVRKEAELFSGQLTELLTKLLAENIKHIWIDGGITVSRFLETVHKPKNLVDCLAHILDEHLHEHREEISIGSFQ